MTQKEIFKNLDLRTQLTDELKEKWYYKTLKWGLKVNKKSVVFDGSFKWQVIFHSAEFEGEEDSFMMLKYYIDGDEVETQMYIQDGDRYADQSKDILEHILVYAANHI